MSDHSQPTSNLTFILVAGAWHTGEIFAGFVQSLQSLGHEAISINKPSSSTTSPPYATFDQDISTTSSEIAKACENGRDVIMVLHSAGGIVGATACKGFEKPRGDGQGSVIGLVYMCAHCAEDGQSPMECAAEANVPAGVSWISMDFAAGYCSVDFTGIPLDQNPFYNDLSEEQANYWSSKLTHQSLDCFQSSKTWAAWKRVPGFYLVTLNDLAVGREAQEYWVGFGETKGARWDIVERVESGHSPMISRPRETLDFVLKAAEESLRLKGRSKDP